jgi:hypothetical protein
MVSANNDALSAGYVRALEVGRPNHDNIQTGYMKADLSLTLHGPDDKFEIALIGKNLNNKLTCGTSGTSDYSEGVAFGNGLHRCADHRRHYLRTGRHRSTELLRRSGSGSVAAPDGEAVQLARVKLYGKPSIVGGLRARLSVVSFCQ